MWTSSGMEGLPHGGKEGAPCGAWLHGGSRSAIGRGGVELLRRCVGPAEWP